MDEATRAALRQFLDLLEGRFPVEDIYLFGSRARGSHAPDSDADVAVLLGGEPQRLVPVKLAMSDLAYDVLLDTGLDISPLPIWREQWENPDRHANPELLRSIVRDGVRP